MVSLLTVSVRAGGPPPDLSKADPIFVRYGGKADIGFGVHRYRATPRTPSWLRSHRARCGCMDLFDTGWELVVRTTMLAVCAALVAVCSAMPRPAKATIFEITFSGQVTGIDTFGLFGPQDASLDGSNYVATFQVDPAQATLSSFVTNPSFGSSAELQGAFEATLEINGKDFNLAGSPDGSCVNCQPGGDVVLSVSEGTNFDSFFAREQDVSDPSDRALAILNQQVLTTVHGQFLLPLDTPFPLGRKRSLSSPGATRASLSWCRLAAPSLKRFDLSQRRSLSLT